MITKSDWQVVHEELLAEERRRLGSAMPDTEDFLAYLRGELSEERAERVREALVCNPELARALTEAFPEDEAAPGEPGYVSDDEIDARWTSLQKLMRVANGEAIPRPDARVLQFWKRTSAALAAAVVVLVCGGILWQWQAGTRRDDAPRVVSLQERWLQPDEGRRGGADTSASTPAEGDTLVHLAPPSDQRTFAVYRLEIIDHGTVPGKTRVTIDRLERSEDGAFSLIVPAASLNPGRHELVLYGVDGGKVERLTSYTLRVPPQPDRVR